MTTYIETSQDGSGNLLETRTYDSTTGFTRTNGTGVVTEGPRPLTAPESAALSAYAGAQNVAAINGTMRANLPTLISNTGLLSPVISGLTDLPGMNNGLSSLAGRIKVLEKTTVALVRKSIDATDSTSGTT